MELAADLEQVQVIWSDCVWWRGFWEM